MTASEKLMEMLHPSVNTAVLIHDPSNIFYLSEGFGGEGLLYLTAERNVIITDFRYVEAAEKAAPDFEIEQTAHDRMQEEHSRLMDKRQRDRDRRIRRKADQIFRKASIGSGYEMSTKDFMIIVPGSADEIRNEGNALHHCVGGYVDRVARGETMILFVRKVSAPDVPFYTLEWNKDHVAQCRGMRNSDMTEDVSAFVQAFERLMLEKAA